MADIQRHGQANWSGDLRSGSGKTSTGSGALRDLPYSVPSRFESASGSNPEELLAAAPQRRHHLLEGQDHVHVRGGQSQPGRQLGHRPAPPLAREVEAGVGLGHAGVAGHCR